MTFYLRELAMNLFEGPDWVKIQEELKESMQKEISLMREMLSSFLQEEIFLLGKNQQAWAGLLQDRSILINQLQDFRKYRDDSAKALLEWSAKRNIDQGEACEITLLLEQVVALTHKINRQNMHNQTLIEQVQQWGSSFTESLLPQPEVILK